MAHEFYVPVSGDFSSSSRTCEELGALNQRLRRLHREAIEARVSGSDRQLEVLCLQFAAAAFRVSSVCAFTQHGLSPDAESDGHAHSEDDEAAEDLRGKQWNKQNTRQQLLSSKVGALQRTLYNAVVNWDALPENIIWAAVHAIKVATGPEVPPEVSQNFGGKLEWYIVPPAPSRYPGRHPGTLHNVVASQSSSGAVAMESAVGINREPRQGMSQARGVYRTSLARAASPLRASVLEWVRQPQSGDFGAGPAESGGSVNNNNNNLDLDLYAVNSPLAILLPALVAMAKGGSLLAQNLSLLIDEVLIPFAEAFMRGASGAAAAAALESSTGRTTDDGDAPISRNLRSGDTDTGVEEGTNHRRGAPREPRRGQTLLAVTSMCVLTQWCDHRRLSGISGSESEHHRGMRLLWFAACGLRSAPVRVIGRVTTAPLRFLSSLMPSFLRRDGDFSRGGAQANAPFAADDNPTGEAVFDPWPDPAAIVGSDAVHAVSAKAGVQRRRAQYYTVLSAIDSSHSRSRLKQMHLLHCASFSVVFSLLLCSERTAGDVGHKNAEGNAAGAAGNISWSFDLILNYVFKLLDQVATYGVDRHRLLESASIVLNPGRQQPSFPALSPPERHSNQTTQAASSSSSSSPSSPSSSAAPAGFQFSATSPPGAAPASWTSRLAAGLRFRGSVQQRSCHLMSGAWSAHEAREDLIEATTVECFRVLNFLLGRHSTDANPRTGQGFRADNSAAVLPRAVRFATDDLQRLVKHTSSGLQPLTHLKLLRFLLVHGSRVGLDIQAALHSFVISVLRYFGSSELVVDQTFCFLWDSCRRPCAPLGNGSSEGAPFAKTSRSLHCVLYELPSAWQQPPGSQFTTLQLYAPAIMKLFAHQPHAARFRLMSLLPQLVARGAAASAVLHLILDLPLIAGVLDVLDLRSFDSFVAQARQQRFNGQAASTRAAKGTHSSAASNSTNGAAHASASSTASQFSPVNRDIPAIEATTMCLLRDTIIDPASGAVVSEAFGGHAASSGAAGQKPGTTSPTADELAHRSWKHCSWGNSSRLARHAARHGPTSASPAPATSSKPSSQNQRQRSRTANVDRVPSSSRQHKTRTDASPPPPPPPPLPHRHTVPTTPSSSTPGSRSSPLLKARIHVFEQLQAAFPGTPRVSEVCALVPELLQLFFDHILDLCLAHQRSKGVDRDAHPTRTSSGTDPFGVDNEAALSMNAEILAAPEAALETVLVCATRVPFIFGPPSYQAVVRRILRDRLLALFELQPSLLSTTHTFLGGICSKIFQQCEFRPPQSPPRDGGVSASAFFTPLQKRTRDKSAAFNRRRDSSGSRTMHGQTKASSMEPSLVAQLSDSRAWSSGSFFESSSTPGAQRGSVPESRPRASPASPASSPFMSPSLPALAFNASAASNSAGLGASRRPTPGWFWTSLQTLLVPVVWVMGEYCRGSLDHPLESGSRGFLRPEDQDPAANSCFLQLVNGINTCVAVLVALNSSSDVATNQNAGHLLSRLTQAVPDLWTAGRPYLAGTASPSPHSGSNAPLNASSRAIAKETPRGVRQQQQQQQQQPTSTPVQHGRTSTQSPFSAHASPMDAGPGPLQSPFISATKETGTPSSKNQGQRLQRESMRTDPVRSEECDEDWLGSNAQVAAHTLRVLLLSLCKLAVFNPHLRSLASKSFQNLLRMERSSASSQNARGVGVGTVPSAVFIHARMMLEIVQRPGMAPGLLSDVRWSLPEFRRRSPPSPAPPPPPGARFFAEIPLPALVQLSPSTCGLAQISSVCSLEGEQPREAGSTDAHPQTGVEPVPSATSETTSAEGDTGTEPSIEEPHAFSEGEHAYVDRPGRQADASTDATEDASAVRDSVVHSLIYRLLQHC